MAKLHRLSSSVWLSGFAAQLGIHIHRHIWAFGMERGNYMSTQEKCIYKRGGTFGHSFLEYSPTRSAVIFCCCDLSNPFAPPAVQF